MKKLYLIKGMEVDDLIKLVDEALERNSNFNTDVFCFGFIVNSDFEISCFSWLDGEIFVDAEALSHFVKDRAIGLI